MWDWREGRGVPEPVPVGGGAFCVSAPHQSARRLVGAGCETESSVECVSAGVIDKLLCCIASPCIDGVVPSAAHDPLTVTPTLCARGTGRVLFVRIPSAGVIDKLLC